MQLIYAFRNKASNQIYQDYERDSCTSNEDNLSTEAALILNESEPMKDETQNNSKYFFILCMNSLYFI